MTQKRTLEEANRLLLEQTESGESASEFCKARGISEQTLSSWKRPANGTQERFVRVSPTRRIQK